MTPNSMAGVSVPIRTLADSGLLTSLFLVRVSQSFPSQYHLHKAYMQQ
jgi:hypothetical protein